MPYKDRRVMREFQREWRAKRRADYFEDRSCVKCGSTEKLELDHIDPSTKKYNPNRLWSMSDSNPDKMAELSKCQVLCKECHDGKTRGDLSKIHTQDYCARWHDMELTRKVLSNGKKLCGYCNYLRRPIREHKSLEEWLEIQNS